MNKPLVSVICLSYNHASFVKEALESVLNQTYTYKEIIVIDDKSSDESVAVIEKTIAEHPEILFIKNEVNLGNCKSFNKALKIAKGEFVIDFATDDIMLPERIEKQIKEFQTLDPDYGVIYGDVITIDEKGKELVGTTTRDVQLSGYIYNELLKRYFISPPSMMTKREVLDELGGYDESLSYEDFDFWIRSSRKFKYHYQREALTKRRIVSGSHSSSFYKKQEMKMSDSTYKVVLKALWLNKSEEENEALAERIRFEMRHAFYMQNFSLVYKYYHLLKSIQKVDVVARIIYNAARLKIPVYTFYKFYNRI